MKGLTVTPGLFIARLVRALIKAGHTDEEVETIVQIIKEVQND